MDTASAIELLRTDDLDPEVIEDVYVRLLVPNFPPAELTDQATFCTCHAQAGPYFPGIIAIHEGLPVGAVFGERHHPSGIVLIGYLAVSAEWRHLHIGSRLLAKATTEWSAVPDTAAVLAEVEDPGRHRDEGHGDPTARLRFYAREGARMVPITYFQPSLRPGSPRVLDMLLLSLVANQRSLASAQLLAFLDDYVTGCEGPPAEDDLDYRKMRESVTRWGATVQLSDLSVHS